MKQERRITYQAGITRTPSDFLSKDGELAECINLVTDHEELKPMVPMKLHKTVYRTAQNNQVEEYRLVYVFRSGGNVLYILMRKSTSLLYYWDSIAGHSYSLLDADARQNPQVTSMGRTLIARADDGIRYYTWDDSVFNNKRFRLLGSELPDFRVTFWLGASGQVAYPENYMSLGENIVNGIRIPYWDPEEYDPDFYPNPAGLKWADDGGYDRGKDALIGLVMSRLEKVKEEKRFAFPFWARAAVRLYDGTYTHISNPFLLMPSVRNNWNIFVSDDNGAPKKMEEGWMKVNYVPLSNQMSFKLTKSDPNINWEDWKDIIKGIDVFVSDEVLTFDTDGTWTILNVDSAEAVAGGTTLADCCCSVYNVPQWHYRREDEAYDTTEDAKIPQFDYYDHTTWRTYFRPKMLTDDEIIRKMVDQSNFYKVVEVDVSELYGASAKFGQNLAAADYIESGALKSLRTLPTLKNDDYFSHSKIMANVMKVYNGRLHLADYRRTLFGGFGSFSNTSYETADIHNRDIYVYVRTDDGDRVVTVIGWNADIPDVWFYYPDPRAYQADVFDRVSDKKLYSFSLKEHPTFWEDNGFEKVNTSGFHYYGCIYAKANNLPVYRKQLYIDYDMEEDSAVEVFPIEPGSVCHTYLMAIHTWNNAGGCKFSLDLVRQVRTIDAFNDIIMEYIGNNLDGGSYLLTINGLDI